MAAAQDKVTTPRAQRGTRPSRPDLDARRRDVARLTVQGFTPREITDQLAELYKHPRTRKPYTCAAIYRDIVFLREEWRRSAAADIADLRASQLAEIAELKRQSWADRDLSEVRMLLDREAKLLGLDAPVRVDITMLARTLAEEAAKLAGFSDEAAAAVAARAEELAQ